MAVNRNKSQQHESTTDLSSWQVLFIHCFSFQQDQCCAKQLHFLPQVQPGNYTAFYDDQRQSWSLKFDSEEARIDFSKEVSINITNLR